ncbi:unnamed protein product, partial [Effrenium voratum]
WWAGDACIFADIGQLGEAAGHCVVHDKDCPIPRVDIFVVGTSCKDLSRANPSKDNTKLVLDQVSSRGGSAQTFQGFVAYVRQHGPSMIVYENVDSIDDAIPQSQQNNLQHLMETMANTGYSGQKLLVDSNQFGLPARRRRLYVVFVKVTNCVFSFSSRPLEACFDSLRSCPRVQVPWDDEDVKQFLIARQDKALKSAGRSQSNSAGSAWIEQHMRYSESAGVRWGQPVPADLACNDWFDTLTDREKDSLLLSRHQAPSAGFRNLSQSVGRVHSQSWSPDSGKHVAPTMLPGQLLFVELTRPARVLLGQEALIMQGFPARRLLAELRHEIDASHGQSQRKWLTESLMTDLAGNAMSLPVLLAIWQAALAAFVLREPSAPVTQADVHATLAALRVVQGGRPMP